MRQGLITRLVYSLFFLSGISGLMYQVVWVRMLSRHTGVTIYATSTVLAAFMAGLALGSYFFGRVMDKRKDRDGLRLYGILEILIAVTALIVPFLFKASVPLYRAVYLATGDTEGLAALVRLVTCFVSLLLPTAMMGATLPVLTTYLVRRNAALGKNFSLLYGLNTLGAVTGVIASGFVTLGEFGEWVTIGIGMAINVGVGLLAFAIARAGAAQAAAGEAPSAPEERVSPYGDAVRRFVLFVSFASGLTALAYEVIWTRQLILFLRTSIYAFSGMLAIFLCGIAFGSLAMKSRVDKLKAPLLVFAGLEMAVGLLSLLNLYLFKPLDSYYMGRIFGLSAVPLAAIVIVFPLTFILGMITPISARCYAASTGRTGSSIGNLYGANTVGSILGALFAGFWLVPTFGSTATVVGLALLNLALGVSMWVMERGVPLPRKLALAPVAILAILLAVGLIGRDPFRDAIEQRIIERRGTTWIPDRLAALPNTHEINFHEEGLEGTITAFEINTFKQFWVNGVGMTFQNTETKLMAHMPLWFADQGNHLLAICFGMGTTIASASLYEDMKVTTVELVPEAFRTFDYYHPGGSEILELDRITPIVNDGRNHLLIADEQYDAITVDPPPPIWSARTVNLYTVEFFELAKARLTPGGVMCLWFPGGTEFEVRSLLRTFSSVFPHTVVMSGPHSWGYFFMGQKQPIDLERVWSRAEAFYADPLLAADMNEYDDSADGAAKIRDLLLWDEAEVAEVAAGGRLITDNYPLTEFPLWRYLLSDRRKWNPQWDLNIGNWKERQEHEQRLRQRMEDELQRQLDELVKPQAALETDVAEGA